MKTHHFDKKIRIYCFVILIWTLVIFISSIILFIYNYSGVGFIVLVIGLIPCNNCSWWLGYIKGYNDGAVVEKNSHKGE